MFEAIASLSGAAVFAGSLLIRALSAQPRMLGHIKNEAEALSGLPDDHPGRVTLSVELNSSVEKYRAYRARSRDRYHLGVGLAMVAGSFAFFGVGLGFRQLHDEINLPGALVSLVEVTSPLAATLSLLVGMGYVLIWAYAASRRLEEALDPGSQDERREKKARRQAKKAAKAGQEAADPHPGK